VTAAAPVVTRVYWTPGTTNHKTGDVPTAHVGATREESIASCQGCPRLAHRNCYAQFGAPGLGHVNIIKRAARTGERYDLASALLNRHPDARMVRVSSVGEPGRLPLSWWQTTAREVRRIGLALVAYTHVWRERPDLAPYAMASCETPAEADEAIAAGFRATVVLPHDFEGRAFTTPAGRRGVVCPAMVAKGVSCNTCRLCDASRKGPVVGFLDHGPQNRGVQREENERLLEQIANDAQNQPVTVPGVRDRYDLPEISARFAVARLVKRGVLVLQRKGRPGRNQPNVYALAQQGAK
jgi:hypothetical protein